MVDLIRKLRDEGVVIIGGLHQLSRSALILDLLLRDT